MFDIENTLAEYGLTPERYEELLKDCSDKVHKVSDMDWSEIAEKYKIDFTYAKCKEKFFMELYELLCSMYGVFEKEETINQKLILTFAKTHGFKSNFYNLHQDINFLQIFLYYKLIFNKDDLTRPFYESGSSLGKIHLSAVEDFVDFKKQYILATHSTCQTAIAAIWVINTFF